MAPRSKHNGLIPAVAYYRMSSDKQEASIPEQREAVQAYAKAHGYRIVREYLDEGLIPKRGTLLALKNSEFSRSFDDPRAPNNAAFRCSSHQNT